MNEKKEDVIRNALSFRYGGMSEGELGQLYDLCVGKKVLELGSMVGMSSYVIAHVCKTLFCVDVWSDNQDHFFDDEQKNIYKLFVPDLPDMLSEFKKNCNTFIENRKIKMFRGNTQLMASEFKNYWFDIILFDADHSYEGVLKDFDLYENKLRKDGMYVFHDYGDSMWTGVKKCCEELVEKNRIIFKNSNERIGVFSRYDSILFSN